MDTREKSPAVAGLAAAAATMELAERVLLSHSGLSRLIDRIEAKGLVERTSCESDRRSFHVRLTVEGEAMLGSMWPVYARGIAEDFLPALGTHPDELRERLETIADSCDAVCEAQERG